MPKLGHFAFDNKIIARGFTSIVYKGIDEITSKFFIYEDKKVAIKCIDEAILDEPGKKKMLANELSIQWQLKQQPYVVEIKGQFYQNDCIYIVSQYCQSGDLKNKIKQKGKFVEAKAVSYMTDIIKGFQTLSRHKIVHRDLKPSNIMISKKGIKIGDFGFAYKITENQQSEEISLPSAGSPLYMAPEVLQDGKNSSYSSDIWSLGVVFFEMLTGRLPFPAKNKETLIKLIDKIVIRTIIPENISPRSKQFLLRTLKKDPMKRMTSQELIHYEFDEEILFNIQLHRQRKLQQEIRKRQEGQLSTSSDDRLSPQEKQKEMQKNQQYNYSHLHNHNPQVDKNQHQHHAHHQTNKDFEPQKPHVTHHVKTVPEQLIAKKSTANKMIDIAQNNRKDLANIIATVNENNISTNVQFDNNQHKGKNFLDPHDIDTKKDRFKRKSAQKNDHIDYHNTLIANENKEQHQQRKQIDMILNKQTSKTSQGEDKNHSNKQSLIEEMKNYEPNSYILHKKPLNYTKRSSDVVKGAENNNKQTQKIHNQQYSSIKQLPLKSYHSNASQDTFSKQPTIHSASDLEENRRVSNHNKLRHSDSRLSQNSNSSNSHSSHHSHEDHSHSPSEEMNKEEIIEILLNQVDIIRFLSRIMHKIEELHHIHTSEKNDRSLSHHSSSGKQSHQHHDTSKQHEPPAIYIQLKQLIYKTIQQIQKLQFLPDDSAYKFFRSQEFDQIKIILDTYKSKLDLVAVKSLQWKGVRLLEKELQREILLIYSTIGNKISQLQAKHLQTDPRELKKLNRKLQALDHLIVFRYDYLILQRQQIFLHETGHKNSHHNEKCSRIKEIIEERHSRTHDGSKSLAECYSQLKKIENVMKKIKLI